MRGVTLEIEAEPRATESHLDIRVTRSQHPGGDLRRVIFSIDAASYGAAPDGAAMVVKYGHSDLERWDFGTLDKSKLAP